MKKFVKMKCIASLVFILSITSPISFAENTKTLNITRISGSDRYDTSIKISEEINNNGIRLRYLQPPPPHQGDSLRPHRR